VARNKGVAITIAGTVYHLRYTFNALAAYEDATGASLMELFAFDDATLREVQGASSDSAAQSALASSGIARQFKMGTIRALLFAGMLHEMPDLTIEGAGDLLEDADGDTLADKCQSVMNAVSSALAQSFGSSAPKAKKKKTA